MTLCLKLEFNGHLVVLQRELQALISRVIPG